MEFPNELENQLPIELQLWKKFKDLMVDTGKNT